jgi:4-hydroxy-tetrahydrodipicolinate synthase
VTDKRDLKEWAKSHFRGYENVLMPSFTPDLAALDEEGIRRDVRQTIEHGFFSTLCAVETGLTFEEKKRFLEIAASEAGSEISVAFSLAGDTLEDNIALLDHAEKVGCTHALLSYPHAFRPRSEEDVWAYASAICESTNLGIYLFASDKFAYHRFHPSGVPFGVFDRLVELPNVIGLKVGGFDSGTILECFERYADKVLVCCLHLGLFPLTVRSYGQQWSGAWTVEALQTVEQPRAVDYFALLRDGREDEAMDIYWSFQPALATMGRLMAPLVPTGTYHWTQLKYYQWLSGGNGGMTRQPCMRLFQRDLDAIRGGFRASGYEITTDPDDAFFVGRTYAATVEPVSSRTRLGGPCP